MSIDYSPIVLRQKTYGDILGEGETLIALPYDRSRFGDNTTGKREEHKIHEIHRKARTENREGGRHAAQ